MKEQELFEHLQENYYPDLVRSQGTYDTFDCRSDDMQMYIELKSRLTHYPTLLLERKKYEAITDMAHRLNYQAWYFNNTPQGIYGFNLSSLPIPKWEVKWLPKTTEFGDRGNIDKEVTFLNTAAADVKQVFKH